MKCGVDREGPSFEPHVSPVALPREGDSVLTGTGSASHLPGLGDRLVVSMKTCLQLEK